MLVVRGGDGKRVTAEGAWPANGLLSIYRNGVGFLKEKRQRCIKLVTNR
jgi:hypothetical protein